MTFSLAKAFAAAGLTALAIRTFERTFQIADAMEEMDSGLRDYYLNESAMHVNDLKTDPEARLHYARTFARVPPALLAVFEVTKALAASRNDQLSEIDYLNRLFGDEGA